MVNRNFNKITFVSIISVLFMVGVGVAYIQSIPNPGIGGDKILVSVDGFKMTLQEAIDYGFFVEGASAPTQSYTSVISNPGHDADEVYVSIKGSEMTLQKAINSAGLCGSGSHLYSSDIELGHSADEVWVSVDGSEMSLQKAINSGELASVDGGWSGYGAWYDSSGWSSCSGCSQSKSQRRDRTCTNPPPTCGGSDCSGSSYQTQTMSQSCGKVNGGWSGWSGWSSCSASCGGGTQTRTRICNNPAPFCGGATCSGSSLEAMSCNTQACMVSGFGCGSCPGGSTKWFDNNWEWCNIPSGSWQYNTGGGPCSISPSTWDNGNWHWGGYNLGGTKHICRVPRWCGAHGGPISWRWYP